MFSRRVEWWGSRSKWRLTIALFRSESHLGSPGSSGSAAKLKPFSSRVMSFSTRLTDWRTRGARSAWRASAILSWGCDGVCGGLDQDGGGVEVNGDKSGIVEKVVVGAAVGDELEMKSAGDGAVIWSVWWE